MDLIVPDDFDKLHFENDSMRGVLASLLEEYEYEIRYLIPMDQTMYLIQLGALRLELLTLQIECRKVRRRLAVLREGQRGLTASDEQKISEEFKQWDDRVNYELSEVERAKARFSNMIQHEDIDEIRDLYRKLSKKMNPDVNEGMGQRASSFWPSVHIAYAANDVFQLKALSMMAEDYPDDYDMPFDITSMKEENERLKQKVADIEKKMFDIRRSASYRWRDVLRSPDKLRAEQIAIRKEIARARADLEVLAEMFAMSTSSCAENSD